MLICFHCLYLGVISVPCIAYYYIFVWSIPRRHLQCPYACISLLEFDHHILIMRARRINHIQQCCCDRPRSQQSRVKTHHRWDRSVSKETGTSSLAQGVCSSLICAWELFKRCCSMMITTWILESWVKERAQTTHRCRVDTRSSL